MILGYTQLKVLTPVLLVELLARCVPAAWLTGELITWDPSEFGHPPADWLKRIWLYLLHGCPSDLSALHSVPLVPVAQKGTTTIMAPLGTKNAMICKVST